MNVMFVGTNGIAKQITKIALNVGRLIILENKRLFKQFKERVKMSKKKDGEIMQMEHDVDSILTIDKNVLDDEWLGQPKLYFQWAVQLEDARAEMDEIKAEFDVAKSDLDLAIRTNPDDYNLPKVTDKSVAAALITQKEYLVAQQELFTAKHRVGVLQAAVTALDHRKKALEKLVDLHGQKYFASPRASEDSREAVGDIEKRSARSKVKISGKKKKR